MSEDVPPVQTGLLFGREANHRPGRARAGRPPRSDWLSNRERDQAMFTDYYVVGLVQQEIAAKYGVSQAYVSKQLEQMRQDGHVDYNLFRAQSIATLAEIRRRQLELTELMPAPVTAGKDGDVVIDPETGEVVRDYAMTLRALADAANTDDKLAKRLGLDAATKAEVAQTVRYEIAGLEVEDLT